MIKSKDRISNFGEVFTSEKEVNAMLNLVESETQRIDSRFLEPACGDGNFLAEILLRKIYEVKRIYGKNEFELQKATFTAVSSLYGIDLLHDNVCQCRKRLFNVVKESITSRLKKKNTKKLLEVIDFVLNKNIVHGDALNLTLPNSESPIVFTEWSFTKGSMVKRTDYKMSNLLAYQLVSSTPLFSDLGNEVYLPVSENSFKAVHFLEVINFDHVWLT